jgi:hypothetical protein
MDRQPEVAFFQDEHPWNTVSKDKAGIESLRKRLQDVLNDHIRRKFPKVRGSDIIAIVPTDLKYVLGSFRSRKTAEIFQGRA